MDDQKREPSPAIPAERLSGSEPLMRQGRELSLKVCDFWRWSVSDLVSNLTRGRLAEFIVAHALEIDVQKGVRREWDPCDLITKDGVKVEVKSAAFVQSWYQKLHSAIGWRVGPTRAWYWETNIWSKERELQADVYVFALLSKQVKTNTDPLNIDLWEFYVVPRSEVSARKGPFTPRLLEARGITAVAFDGLRAAVRAAAGKAE
jgi:hypothetical protein